MNAGQEIYFRNEIQNLDLAGLFFIPEGDGLFPVAVIIHGSGPSSRQNRWYLTLVHHLQENGIAVLLPDKRGSEKSQGNWYTSSMEDLATDTIAAVNYLKAQRDVSLSSIGMIGISQGGWIAPIVALETPDLAFVIDLVGTSVPAHEQLLYEENHNLQQMGIWPGVSQVAAYLTTFILRKITQKDFWDAIGNFDPLPHWQKVELPTLVLYGAEDTNVPTAASVARFKSLNKGNITVKVYEGSGHALQDLPGQGDRIFRLDALNEITKFIRQIDN